MRRVEWKPIDWFKLPPQARKVFDRDKLMQLGKSLLKRQLQAVLARPDGTVLAGQRRVLGIEAAGGKEVLTDITDEPLTEADIRVIAIAENVHRVGLTGFELFQACKDLLDLNVEWKQKDLAEHLDFSTGEISKILSPLKCPEAARNALAEGTITLSHCYRISQGASDEEKLKLLEAALAGASREALEDQLRTAKPSTAPAERVAQVRCPLPNGVTVTVRGTSHHVSLDDVIRACGDLQKEAARAKRDGLDARVFAAVLKQRSAAAK